MRAARWCVVEAEEKFAGESVGTCGVGDDCGRVGEKARVVSDIRIHPTAERREKVGALGKITRRLAVQRPPERAGVRGTQAVAGEFAL